jgi:hypothetical protein
MSKKKTMKEVRTRYTYPNPPTMCGGQPVYQAVMVQRVVEFTLANTPPKPARKPLGNESNGGVQKMLLTGLDCPSGTRNLFNVDGGGE